ncbi:hypothetical protein KI809_08075 [Geobacter pelophilus]|jgi:hypothetical protein|uniref:Uncharacterized protein n=1 Tax=Geoanaerobacter pelophilus TaxID=60036 RepID=A0AAW4L3X2_9BACT|nr:hypothetical protein [Geoanaerobacter pelophilus]MBT0664257.1 hypothetical protein [Geoanaerobacter pelophilus]
MLKKACFLLIAFLFLLGGCTKDPNKQLVGRWQEIGNPKGVLVFASNHTGRAYWPDKEGRQQSEAMKWVVLKKENKVSVITPPGPVNFEIKDDRLVAPNGVVLTKVK